MLGGVLIGAIVYSIWTYGVGAYVGRMKFEPIPPGPVTVLGLRSGSGFRIRVVNQVAQLVKLAPGQEKLTEGDTGEDSGSDDSSSSTNSGQIIVMRDLLGSLAGDPKYLASFVEDINKLHDEKTWPSLEIVWKAEDIAKAISGDPVLSKKLVQDLNVQLDGTPLNTLSRRALENGIIVDSPVILHVKVGDEQKQLVARVEVPYTPQILGKTGADFAKKFNVTDQIRSAYYAAHVEAEAKGDEPRENVKASLMNLINPEELAKYASEPERILNSCDVVITDKFITHASYEKTPINGHDFFTLNVDVNDEGRKRLWQYSHNHMGDQLLLVSNGVAIAAPVIHHELFSSQLQVNQMPDEVLVQDAVQSINTHSASE